MDKNTIIGMLLMCAVIFGFTYLNRPSQAQLDEQRRQDSIENVNRSRQAAQASDAVRDTLSVTEIQNIKDVLTKLNADSAAQGRGIEANGVNVKLVGESLEGNIALKGTNVSIADLLAGKIQDPATQNSAVATLKNAVDSYVRNGAFASNLSGKEEIITLKNDSLKVELSTKGGVVSKATLMRYSAYNAQNVDVIDKDNSYGFILNGATQNFDTGDFFFTPNQLNDSVATMTIDLGNGAKWGIKYTLVPESYMLRMEIEQQNMDAILGNVVPMMGFRWNQKMARHEAGKMFEERNSAVYYKYAGEDGDVENLKESGNDDKEVKEHVKWFSTKNQFFSAVLIADQYFSGANMKSEEIAKDDPDYQNYMKNMSITSEIEYNATNPKPASFYFYLGPNRYKTMRDYDKFSPKEDLKLTKLIPLGWKLFRWINTGVIIPVFNWLGSFISNYGIIILLLTIFIKIVIAPFTLKSYMSQAKMRVLQPDIKAINEKYPGQENAIKRQQKTMELYSKAGASPLGGCLPMLLQMPILIAMFTFFPSCIELRGQSFLWAQDLSAPDAIVSWTGQIPFVTNYFGNHISLFCLLMTVTNIVYTYLTMQSQDQSNAMPGMKWMMYLMPIMFLVFFNNYASGLSYYYFISLLITIAQTYACRAFVSEDKVRAKIAENAKKPKKKSGFMARLEEAQRMQQAQLREQQKRNGKRRN